MVGVGFAEHIAISPRWESGSPHHWCDLKPWSQQWPSQPFSLVGWQRPSFLVHCQSLHAWSRNAYHHNDRTKSKENIFLVTKYTTCRWNLIPKWSSVRRKQLFRRYIMYADSHTNVGAAFKNHPCWVVPGLPWLWNPHQANMRLASSRIPFLVTAWVRGKHLNSRFHHVGKSLCVQLLQIAASSRYVFLYVVVMYVIVKMDFAALDCMRSSGCFTKWEVVTAHDLNQPNDRPAHATCLIKWVKSINQLSGYN